MCGIFFSCSRQNDLPPSSGVLDCLKRRGPDDQQGVQLRLEVPKCAGSTLMHVFHLTLVSTVLSLRGNEVVRQPLEDPLSGSLLCWNGEVWKIDGTIFGGNDVQPIFSLLLEATKRNTVGHDDRSIAYAETLQAVINVITCLSGPYAFVFYDARHQRIFYGRDILGRRSLLYKSAEDGNLTVSSICDGSVSDAWSEVEANGIYMLDLAIGRTDSENEDYVLKHIPWSKEEDGSGLCPCLVRCARTFARSL
jgi:asparagine synthetase B (glutamine-hydrolysing)